MRVKVLYILVMANPEEFSLEAVRDFMIQRGGRVTNHELVQQFKVFLTNTESKGRLI